MPELGSKYECYNCEAKFYDMGKPEPICPKCQANQNDAQEAKDGEPELDAETLKRARTTFRGDEGGAADDDTLIDDDKEGEEDEDDD